MPTIFRHKGYRFFFYSNEGLPLEPPHVHVRCGEGVAKFWLVPQVTLADSLGMSFVELNEVQRIVRERRQDFERAWHEYFG